MSPCRMLKKINLSKPFSLMDEIDQQQRQHLVTETNDQFSIIVKF